MALSPGALSAAYTLRLGPPQHIELRSEPGGGKRLVFSQPVCADELPDEFPCELDGGRATALLVPPVAGCDLLVLLGTESGTLVLDVRYTRRTH
jgi:hypothetical protein